MMKGSGSVPLEHAIMQAREKPKGPWEISEEALQEIQISALLRLAIAHKVYSHDPFKALRAFKDSYQALFVF